MSTEIKIIPIKINTAEGLLETMQNNLTNRSASISFTSSKGETVDKLIELAKRMEDAKNKLALLYGNTASALMATRESFNETDNCIANYFYTSWERTNEE